MSISVSAVEERVRAAVAARRDDATALLTELVAIDSTNPVFLDREAVATHGERRCNEVLAARFAAAGCETIWVAPDPDRPSLVCRRAGGGGGRSLVLNGHVDTVAADPPSWTTDPWQPVQRDGALYGLGSADMKAGLTAIWAALQALDDAKVALLGDLLVHSVVGEEAMEHELGTTACVRAGYGADAAIVAEPTSMSRRLMVTGTSGGYWSLRIDIEGRTTHCANRPHLVRAGGGGDAVGVSALEKAVRLVTALQELEQRWGFTKRHPSCAPGAFTIMPGRLHADSQAEGPAPVYVPDRATLEYSIVYPPQESPTQVAEEIEAFVRDVCRLDTWLADHPPTLTWGVNWPALDTSWDEPIVATLVEARAVATGDVQPRPTPAEPVAYAPQDAAWYAREGIPAVCFGPGALRVAHTAGEHVALEEVVQAATALAICAVRWCGTSG
jgi:acetylornithine deacetylase/succinyl-diaminopimelate desuccinylase-like protein